MLRRQSLNYPFREAAESAQGLDRCRLGRSALWLILLVPSSTGCYSSRTTGLDDFDLFLRFSVNGTVVEYPAIGNVFGVFTNYCLGGPKVINVVAWDSTSGLRLRMSSGRQASNPLGTYSIAHVEDDPTFRLSMYYQDPEGTEYLANPVVPEDATIVISQVGPRTMSGTFFGVVKAPDRADVLITDGEFVVRREFDITVCNY